MTAKYAPANDEGLKPYVVTRKGWGRETTVIAYAEKPADAKYIAFGRLGVGDYIASCRRAAPEDIQD